MMLMATTAVSRKVLPPALCFLLAILLPLVVNDVNTSVFAGLNEQFPNVHVYIRDLFSDAIWLFVVILAVVWDPRLFGFQIGDIFRHKKFLLGMLAFFIGAPLAYRLLMGGIPFSANTWFFEGIVVPLAEEGFFRGVILTMLLFAFGMLYPEKKAQTLAVSFGAILFGTMHLNNLGEYPTGFIIFQAFYSILFGLLFGWSRIKTNSIYPPILLHAIVNLVGTIG